VLALGAAIGVLISVAKQKNNKTPAVNKLTLNTIKLTYQAPSSMGLFIAQPEAAIGCHFFICNGDV